MCIPLWRRLPAFRRDKLPPYSRYSWQNIKTGTGGLRTEALVKEEA
jgi:hypothetical protein